MANPTVTVLPNSLHRQLGPARFLSEAKESRRGGGMAGASETQSRSRKKKIRQRERGTIAEDSGLEPDLLSGLTPNSQSVCVRKRNFDD